MPRTPRTLLVVPPFGSAADLLVALGNAGVGVTHLEPSGHDPRALVVAVDRDPDLAVRILEGIGCDVVTESASLMGSSTRGARLRPAAAELGAGY